MASKELIEKVARALYRSDYGNEFGFHQKDVAKAYSLNAEAAISTILAALQEPTEAALATGYAWDEHVSSTETHPRNRGLWRAMLNASALGEKAE